MPLSERPGAEGVGAASSASAGIALFVPGLLPPDPLPSTLSRGQFPLLERLLARAARRDSLEPSCYERTLLALFGNPPAAPLTLLLDADRADPETAWMRADPVHFAPTRDGLVLLEASRCPLREEQSRRLADEAAAAFHALDAQLIAPHPARWYLRLPRTPQLCTVPPGRAVGRNVRGLLPSGPDGAQWNRALNEAQMIMHAAAVNRERSHRGELPVNALWCWGAGTLPRAGTPVFDYVFSDEPLALAAARWQGAAYDAPLTADTVPPHRALVVLTAGYFSGLYGDEEEWLQAMRRFEREWWAPLVDRLRRGRIPALGLLAPGCEFHLRRPHLWRLWRRPRPLADYLPDAVPAANETAAWPRPGERRASGQKGRYQEQGDDG